MSHPVATADYVGELRAAVEGGASELLAADETAAAWRPPGTGRWSAKEVVGHLVDSAANNHQRFVRARWQEDLVFAGYDQEAWVAAQRYQEAPWPELVTLWRDYNRHLARVMASVPPDVAARPRRRHNLHEIAWRTVPADEPATLDYFMRDYVGHLQHHLRQIRRLLADAPAR